MLVAIGLELPVDAAQRRCYIGRRSRSSLGVCSPRSPMLRFSLLPLCVAAMLLALAGCEAESEGPASAPTGYDSGTSIELQDIFVPERLVELPVMPAGTQRLNEIYVHNAGDRDLFIDEMSLNYQSDDNWVLIESTVPETIAPHQHAVVQVSYTAVEGGDTFAALDIYSDDPDEAEKTVAFIGRQATGGPVAGIDANILDWGFQFRGVESRKILGIRNDGDEDLRVTGIELIQSETQAAFQLACPGEPLDQCDWGSQSLPALLDAPIVPGSGALLELVFIPANLQSVSAQLKIQTSDPVRPEFTVFLLGNGESALNCTPPTVQVVSPPEATFYHQWQDLEVTVRVFDQEQPPGSIYVELFLGTLLIEDEIPDENGFATFVLDIDDHTPSIPTGLQPFTVRGTDGCRLWGFDSFVAAIDFPLSATDVDGDGFDSNQGDCDENNADIFPQAQEVFDGFDNDCDGSVDEGTEVWDDDCDGYCEHDTLCVGQGPSPDGVTECLGLADTPYLDCNDSPSDLNGDDVADGATIHPNAEEALNFLDDDCDGTTDEGTTFFDDDGDGQTEAVGDCDDSTDQVFAGAIEWCDELDNDCDGAVDNDCIDQTAPPRIIGGVIVDRFQVELGSRVQAQVLVVSPDDNLTYTWEGDMGGWYDEPATGSLVFWNAPEDSDENRTLYYGEFPSLMVTVTDSLGQSATAFGNVLISQQVTTAYAPVLATQKGGAGGCAVVGSGAAAGVGWLALVLVGAFRRLRRAPLLSRRPS